MSLPSSLRPKRHDFENVGNTDGSCGFCGLSHPDYGDPADVLPDPPPPPAGFGADDAHLSVPCPECGAGVGYHCTSRFGTYYAGHTQRRANA